MSATVTALCMPQTGVGGGEGTCQNHILQQAGNLKIFGCKTFKRSTSSGCLYKPDQFLSPPCILGCAQTSFFHTGSIRLLKVPPYVLHWTPPQTRSSEPAEYLAEGNRNTYPSWKKVVKTFIMTAWSAVETSVHQHVYVYNFHQSSLLKSFPLSFSLHLI